MFQGGRFPHPSGDQRRENAKACFAWLFELIRTVITREGG
jgi:hypothetical protein